MEHYQESIITDKDSHCILRKGSIYQEDSTILKLFLSNTIASKYLRQKLTELQGEIQKSTFIVGF